MRTIFLLLLSIVSIHVFGQSVDDLDKKGGFKSFKIGDDYSAHSDKIRFIKNLENADSKQYVARDPVTVMGHTGEVGLTFYKAKLTAITVSFKNSSKQDFQELFESLETLYGASEVPKDKNKDKELERFEKIFVWSGKLIGLRMGYDEKYNLSEMAFYQQKGKLEKLKEEF